MRLRKGRACFVGKMSVASSRGLQGASPARPFGGPFQGQRLGGKAPAPAKAAAPAPSCVTADLFSDCFAGCSGTLTPGSPGPVCGWRLDEDVGTTTGSVVLAPGSMTFVNPDQLQQIGAHKGLSIPGVFNLTGQYQFSEFPGTLGVGTGSYTLVVDDFAHLGWIVILLEDSGVANFIVGPQPDGWSNYSGTWTPNGGAHAVHFTVDGAGVPRLWVDGMEIPLTFTGIGAGGPNPPHDKVEFLTLNFDGPGPEKSSVMTALFLASGNHPPTTTFCC